MDWTDLLTAVALVLVLEGIMPFLNPRGVRQALDRVRDLSDVTLRTIGFASMLAGVVLLALVR